MNKRDEAIHTGTLSDRVFSERTARLAAEARVRELTEALAAVLNTSGKIVSGSPGPLYNAGFSAGVKHCQDVARSTLHPGDGG